MHNESTSQITREKRLPNILQENNGRSLLHNAASTGDEKAVEELLVAGSDRNAKEPQYGNTPLHEAAWKGYSRCVKILCSLPKIKSNKISIDITKEAKIKNVLQDTKGALHSALLETRNYGGFSALHLASQNGHNQSCREILLAGADPDVQNNYGDSPLHTACRYGHAGAIRILLSAKCDFERINLNGDTALHIACAMGRRKLTRILLEAGCRQNVQNAQGETPRDIVIRKNLHEILQILNTSVPVNRNLRERSSSGSQNARVSKSRERTKSRDKSNTANDIKYDVDPKHWSPYGCHYFPDPRNFPSPKLETLPKEPLLTGEQYYLDLAGNICKGPVGVGNTCYCAPFFKHLEQRMNQNRRSLKKYVNRATEKIDIKVNALATRTDDQIEELTKSMIANRVRCENKRLHLEQWLKRGVMTRSTAPYTSSKSKKDEANTNTLTRCRSLEFLDGNDEVFPGHIKSSTPQFSRSIDFLDETHSQPQHIDKCILYSSDHSNIRNHSDMDDEKRRNSKRSSSISQMSGKESYTYSDKDNDKEKSQKIHEKAGSSNYGGSLREDLKRFSVNTSVASSGYEPKFEKIQVAERLEDLLSKTKKIFEFEQLSKKKQRKENKYILALDKIQKNNLEGNSPRMDGSYDIAQEMEKITQSLLMKHNSKSNSGQTPTSPEILKDISHQKEISRSRYYYKNEKSGSSVSPYSHMSPSSSLFGVDQRNVVNVDDMLSTNFTEDVLENSGIESDNDVEPEARRINGFYTNNCFEDVHSSSNTTIRSNSNLAEEIQQEESHNLVGDESDEECDISDMANFSELKELKSRILNGTNWRSQVLQKSVHDLFNTVTNEKTDSQFPAEESNDAVDGKYEIRHARESLQNTQQEAEEMHGNRVQYIISKLQNEQLAQTEPNSCTSEDDDDSNIPVVHVNARTLIQRFEQVSPSTLIPKDAYFHDLPHKTLTNDGMLSRHARNRNPLPTYLNENEIFSNNDATVSIARGDNEEKREKLLTSRRFNQPKATEYLLASQDDITEDSGYVSTKVSEHYNTSANDLAINLQSKLSLNRLSKQVNSSNNYDDIYNLGASSLV